MKRLLLSLVVLAGFCICLGGSAKKAIADCVGTPELVKQAQDFKAQAVEARDAEDYDQAASFYLKAADVHPKEDVKASYTMNAVGALVGVWNPSGGYRHSGTWVWDETRGPGNLDKAIQLCKKAKLLLDSANAADCHSKGVNAAALEEWIETQSDWLQKMKVAIASGK